MKKFEAAQATWAKGCNDIELVKLNKEHRKIRMPVKQNKENSTWSLLCKSLMKISNKHQWVLIVNDNTFALLENLRLLTAPLNYTRNYYLGHPVQFWSINYNTGLAGYVLSQGSIKELQKRLNNDSCITEITYLNQEDFYIGKLLSTLNIFPQDTRDSLGLTTFHSYNWYQEFFSSANYYRMSIYPVVCCSSQSITFQATEADKMYMYYYLLYQLEVFHDGNLGNRPASTPIPEEQVWKSFLKERGITKDYVSAEEYYKIWEDLVHDPVEFLKEMRDKKVDYR
ncbi:beta13-galactosyltransferase [Holotrichia oblita]|uniref:Beta13-galactosyltransferase n=2 Tax=Holotrichia oblita TaxID=644536 RepID=A0ACB9T6A3_HOLOL|nr:beta13-galactosyltransferase [Holotrichia oblita]KAI4462345.1 beta13-galactosyltransferase [Holotrichia oblita]